VSDWNTGRNTYRVCPRCNGVGGVPLTIKDRVADMVLAYRAANGTRPSDLHLTYVEETEMLYLNADDLGDELASRLHEHGSRGAFPTFMGMRVIWDAKVFRVDRGKEGSRT
jgi:hypothetical protein